MSRLRATLAILFVSPLVSPVWLALRIYLGLIWIRFGTGKIEAGWLAGNELEPLLRAVAGGGTPAPIGAFRGVAALLLGLHLDALLSTAIPLFEIGVGVAFLSGVLLVPAAAAASVMNLNLILFGIASWRFDGRIILLQLLIVAGWRAAGYLGVARLRDLARVAHAAVRR
jgi:uncharacterized membrane protein YphA (DoxX/SURF4 family)